MVFVFLHFLLFQLLTMRQNVWLFLTQKTNKKYPILNILILYL